MAEPAASGQLPLVIVGDVHGDFERLFKALEPHPPDRCRTLFLGDLVDNGPFGAGCLRYAHDRPNSELLLGNHEVALLWALREPGHISSWLGIGGQLHDLEEMRRRPELVTWLERRPLMLRLEDGTLVQHTDGDAYTWLLEPDAPDPVAAINQAAHDLIATGGFERLWRVLTTRSGFRDHRPRLERYLAAMGARRLVHGHTPHSGRLPDRYHDGLAIDFDGALSRWHPRGRYRLRPASATVNVLEPLPPPG